MLPSSTDAAVACPLDTLRRGRQPLTAAFLAVFIAAFAYVRYTGLIVFMGDTFLLANRAKHFADEFNLHVSHGVSPIIYPPLYSLVLSIAYLFDDPADIFKVTLALHVLLTASQVVPLFLLLRQYCHLDAKPAAAMAAVLALSPSALPYTSIALTEVLYCPVILWLVVVLSQVWIAGDRVKYLAAGTVFAVAMLTRSAATAVVLAYALTGIVLLWLYRKEAEQSKFTKRGLALSASLSPSSSAAGVCLSESSFTTKAPTLNLRWLPCSAFSPISAASICTPPGLRTAFSTFLPLPFRWPARFRWSSSCGAPPCFAVIRWRSFSSYPYSVPPPYVRWSSPIPGAVAT